MTNSEHLLSWIRFPKDYWGFLGSLSFSKSAPDLFMASSHLFTFPSPLPSSLKSFFTLKAFSSTSSASLWHFIDVLLERLSGYPEFLVLCIFSQLSAQIVFCQSFSRAVLNIWQLVISQLIQLFMSCRASSSSQRRKRWPADLRSDGELCNGLYEALKDKHLLCLSVSAAGDVDHSRQSLVELVIVRVL